MDSTDKTPNKLISEKSPYLLQHAYNPVQWYPWGDEVFAKAKTEDKPIFLSIGYSTCHWCHVMERESFEDEEVAALLNEHFISIKVDREERPDVDTIYMSVCQAMTGHGGWPLTVIMTPDKKPFFSGTYFPKHSRMGMPGVMELLTQIAKLWTDKRQDLLDASEKITESVEQGYLTHEQGDISEEALHKAYKYYERAFDAKYGGFGSAPKFPTPHNLSFLLRYWKMTGKDKALQMVEKTLESMYRGGIYNHVGFGFARYSTDKEWLVPHFEKMLYDNALLAIAYTEVYQATGKNEYARIAKEIFTYILRDMTSPEGGFYSAEDADSEGEEGKFYVWSPEEVKAVLGDDVGKQYCKQYDITDSGNFEGKNIPNLIKTGWAEGFEAAGNKLFLHREERIHPFKDDKILTAWNGLMIAAMAFGSRALKEPKLAEAASNSVSFILNHLRREDGRLLARYRDGEAAFLAYVDDYAFLIWGLIELYQATFVPEYLALAQDLNQDMLKLFWDEDNGGLYQYGNDAEQLISRPKEIYDGAIPAGNSVATLNFLRLARLTGDLELEKLAEKQFQAFGGTISEHPMGYSHFMMAVLFSHLSTTEVTIVGNIDAPDTQEMLKQINSGFYPELVVLLKPLKEDESKFNQVLPGLAERKPIDDKATAFVCSNFACQPPTTDPAELGRLIQ